jgi:ABC-2 type transport system permease protein
MRQEYIGTDETGKFIEKIRLALKRDLVSIHNYRHFIFFNLVSKLKIQYQRSYLGLFWTILTPLMSLAILSLVFGHIIGRNIPNYHVYLFSGMVPFTFFQQTVLVGGVSLIVNEASAKSSNIPLIIYPINELCFQLINMLFSLIGVFVILLFLGIEVSYHIILLPVYIIIWAIFSFGVSLVSMTLITYLRDFEHFFSVIFRGLYFMSPIILFPEMLGEYKFIMIFNPITYFINFFRSSFYSGTFPDPKTWIITSVFTLLAIVLGYIVYKKFEIKYIFRL